MPSQKIPTIKGMFVQSHIESLRKTRGDHAVIELEQRVGRPLFFKRLEDVPVVLEVAVIETCYDLIYEGHTLSPAERERAAGCLHFANFADTTMGSMLMRSMPHTKASFQTMLFNIGTIARSIIKHIEFRAEDIHDGVCVTMKGTEYPPAHFQGFFEEWMTQWDIAGSVAVMIKAPRVHVYRLTL